MDKPGDFAVNTRKRALGNGEILSNIWTSLKLM